MQEMEQEYIVNKLQKTVSPYLLCDCLVESQGAVGSVAVCCVAIHWLCMATINITRCTKAIALHF